MHHTDEGYYELRSKVRVAAKEALAKQGHGEKQIKTGYSGWSQVIEMLTPQPNQEQGEPVAYVDDAGVIVVCSYKYKAGDKLYTTPQQRKPLTMFDTEKLAKQCGVEWTTRIDKLCKLASSHSNKE
jgi:hypothetical protein